jgi:hypothetical protein
MTWTKLFTDIHSLELVQSHNANTRECILAIISNALKEFIPFYSLYNEVRSLK